MKGQEIKVDNKFLKAVARLEKWRMGRHRKRCYEICIDLDDVVIIRLYCCAKFYGLLESAAAKGKMARLGSVVGRAFKKLGIVKDL